MSAVSAALRQIADDIERRRFFLDLDDITDVTDERVRAELAALSGFLQPIFASVALLAAEALRRRADAVEARDR